MLLWARLWHLTLRNSDQTLEIHVHVDCLSALLENSAHLALAQLTAVLPCYPQTTSQCRDFSIHQVELSFRVRAPVEVHTSAAAAALDYHYHLIGPVYHQLVADVPTFAAVFRTLDLSSHFLCLRMAIDVAADDPPVGQLRNGGEL